MKGNQKYREVRSNNDANGQMIGVVVGLFITIAIAVLVYYNIMASMDTDTLDAEFNGTPAANATEDINDQAATFFQLAPIIGIVIIAVVILGYVNRIGG